MEANTKLHHHIFSRCWKKSFDSAEFIFQGLKPGLPAEAPTMIFATPTKLVSEVTGTVEYMGTNKVPDFQKLFQVMTETRSTYFFFCACLLSLVNTITALLSSCLNLHNPQLIKVWAKRVELRLCETTVAVDQCCDSFYTPIVFPHPIDHS